MWEGVGDWTELQHIDPHSYGHQRFFPALQGCSTRGLGAYSAGCWLPQPHLVTNGSDLQTNWLPVSPSYIIVQSPTQHLPLTGHRMCHFHRLWNGMFDRHQVEITVMQFTGHSLPVHQSVSVPWDFNPIPHCQPSSPMPMEYALPPSLELHVWPGRRSIYNTRLLFKLSYYNVIVQYINQNIRRNPQLDCVLHIYIYIYIRIFLSW